MLVKICRKLSARPGGTRTIPCVPPSRRGPSEAAPRKIPRRYRRQPLPPPPLQRRLHCSNLIGLLLDTMQRTRVSCHNWRGGCRAVREAHRVPAAFLSCVVKRLVNRRARSDYEIRSYLPARRRFTTRQVLQRVGTPYARFNTSVLRTIAHVYRGVTVKYLGRV